MLHRDPGPPGTHRAWQALPAAVVVAALMSAPPAWGWVDIFDRGPALVAGKFNLRVTNAGLVGNPFPDLSFDPSFEYPKGSGQELMRYGALWVGALDVDGVPRVSGGPLLEFRPTVAPADTVRQLWHGRFGGGRLEDDDGDGKIDEEVYNDLDDDGDGEIDEDLGVVGQQMLIADYTDDQPEAIRFQEGGGESHRPLGLSVHQEAYAWSWPGYDGIAGLQFTITNHGGATLRELYLGFYVDLDSRTRGELYNSSNDAIARVSFSRSFPKGTSRVFVDGQGVLVRSCSNRVGRTVAVVDEPIGSPTPDLPVLAVLPLEHTRDPLSWIIPSAGRAPARDTFRVAIYAADRISGAGGEPLVDVDRYAALKGEWTESSDSHVGDQIVLLSCGPFHTLAPGQSLDFAVALVAAPSLDSLRVYLGNAAFLHNGTELNLLPDATGPGANWWSVGETGLNGHEACIEPPPGLVFTYDPNCSIKFADPNGPNPIDPPFVHQAVYQAGSCVWTDADCNVCTGLNGNETVVRWLDPFAVPPSPSFRVVPGDHAVRIEWDNLPEILVNAGKTGPRGGHFNGYRLWRMADWYGRRSLIPGREEWEALGTFGYDSVDSKVLLSTITDSTLDYRRIWYEQKHYPIGRYAYIDTQPLNGFNYLYVVTSVVETRTPYFGFDRIDRYESPLVVGIEEVAAPRAEARGDALGVWVVPNPFRAAAAWDRTAVYGDRLTRHLDFMGLPRARCTIRIWTVAGDQVATLDHDGSNGSGEAAWNLVSRNGQEVASGIYLYTVDSPLGSASGRFVVIR
jgi:hypothetical protein